jgi:hypothetical protein
MKSSKSGTSRHEKDYDSTLLWGGRVKLNRYVVRYTHQGYDIDLKRRIVFSAAVFLYPE